MKKQYCEMEPAVVAAMRSGTLNAEMLDHAAGCESCSDVLLVTEFLRDESASLDSVLRTPDAAVIWRKARARAREEALAKATLPIRVVRVCSYTLAILAAPWIVLEFSRRPVWLPDIGLKHLSAMDGNWVSALNGTIVLSLAAMFICVVLSSWFVLRAE
jgi:hypothetical protein